MQTNLSSRRQINHKVMRVIIGAIALLLSPIVWLLSGSENELTSISISYWTDSHDIFVGSLIVVGFFLSAYNGAGEKRDWEYYISKVAWVFAICVAIFPTVGFSDVDVPAEWVQAVSGLIGLAPETIHSGAAALLFICLIALMWFFSDRAMKKGKPKRAIFYRTVSVLMGSGIVGLLVIGNVLKLNDTIFWVEVWGLTLFGIGWLVAGSYRTDSDAGGVKGTV
jgi:hypothetical protein